MDEHIVRPDQGSIELDHVVIEPQPREELWRNSGAEHLDEQDPYQTSMNGLKANVDSIGIFGFMMLADPDAMQVVPDDLVYVTAEPYNAAPLEILTAYRRSEPSGRTTVELAVFDWGIPNPEQRWQSLVRNLPENQAFLEQFGHRLPLTIPGAPSGGPLGFWFKNFYVAERQQHMVHFRNPATGNWQLVYKSPVKGSPPAPTPAGARSGWATLEYKRHRKYHYTQAWTSIRHPVGFANVCLLPRSGNWFRPSGSQTIWDANLNKYARVWEEPVFSFAYRDWS